MPILTINSGSSSLKFGLYADDGQTVLLTGSATGIGKAESAFVLKDAADKPLSHSNAGLRHQQDAMETIAGQLTRFANEPVTAIGHRIVHGGPHLVTHQALTPKVLEILKASVHFAPLHIPPALELIASSEKLFRNVPQFACFDTAFHQTMPPEAFTYAIPAPYRQAGVRRFGFHGLSYESIVHALSPAVPSRLIVAHLGSGSSVCAMLHGRSVDTSMGASPTGGLVMGTRSGDLDPGVLLLLERSLTPQLAGLGTDQVEALLNHESGLKALAGDSDMQSLLQRSDADAGLAIDIFCREVAKTIAAYTTVLGGLDALVFTGGIGEHSQSIRDNIVARLAHLQPPAPQTITADEDGQIARHVHQLQSRPDSLWPG
jgi:acetate kinase